MEQPPFDELSSAYEELLKDPIRNRFSGEESLFFHRRKCDLIRQFFRRCRIDTARLHYLDVGCGRGELLNLLRTDFANVAGCDVSKGMMQQIMGVETRIQDNPLSIPFADASFDFITAVCVYHHVPPVARPALTNEIVRILRPGGIFCMIEHNPLNPITRLIVSRTPIDADAILLQAREARALAGEAGLRPIAQQYFLYLPQGADRYLGAVEPLLSKIPLGGQYAVFSKRHAATDQNPAFAKST